MWRLYVNIHRIHTDTVSYESLKPLRHRMNWCELGFLVPCMYSYYPHMPIGKVWMYRLLFVFVCVCTVTDFSAEDKASLAASNFSRRFIGVQGRESHIFVNFAATEAKSWTNRPARGPRPPGCKRYRRDASTWTSRCRCAVRGISCGNYDS